MSLRSNTQHRLRMSSEDFSTKSLGSYSISRIGTPNHGAPITAVTFNTSLLTPLKTDIDPTVHAVRTKEKEQIKSLNNRFASFIDKVRNLEQQNKMLETKWKLLQEQAAAPANTEPMLKAYIANLQRQLELLTDDKNRLDVKCIDTHRQVDDYKTKYEEEVNRRVDAENEFVLLKKDVDTGYLSRVDLSDRVVAISDEINFLKALYDAELRELQENLKDTSVVVQMDNSRGLNMDQIMSDVRAQYEEIASRSRKDTENWYKIKFNQMASEANKYDSELHATKGEIAELKRIISRIQHEIETLSMQRSNIEGNIADAEQRGERAVLDAKSRIKELEQALQKAKQDMAWQLKEYQELMNLKLALDIEISTYRKLLEGEEERLGQVSVVNIQTAPTHTAMVNSHQPKRSGPVLIKTVETHNRSYS